MAYNKADESIKRMNAKQMKKDRTTLHPPFKTVRDQKRIKNRVEYALPTPINISALEAMSQKYKGNCIVKRKW